MQVYADTIDLSHIIKAGYFLPYKTITHRNYDKHENQHSQSIPIFFFIHNRLVIGGVYDISMVLTSFSQKIARVVTLKPTLAACKTTFSATYDTKSNIMIVSYNIKEHQYRVSLHGFIQNNFVRNGRQVLHVYVHLKINFRQCLSISISPLFLLGGIPLAY